MPLRPAGVRGLLVCLLLHYAACDDGAMTRSCDKDALRVCRAAYERCLVYSGPAGEGYKQIKCDCADEYFGACGRRAGCASALLRQCIDALDESDCEDSSVCGSNCVGNGNAQIGPDAIVIPVNNFGPNALRFSVCARRENARSLERYSTVVMERCEGPGLDGRVLFHECPYWVPPHTFTALAFESNASYLKMEYCVIAADVQGQETGHFRCLEDPRPVEYYGTALHWPSSIDVQFASAPYCQSDEDCSGTFCDRIHSPPLCSPKTQVQFDGPAETFMKVRRDELPKPEL
ncbi:hypothetical protein M885DRAFT_612617 [Pelagophyceae sp. CCMP2097]|nr:hypothetical protein M885DRAFT_612617 [Pelagophyceae sp. CCMP2097]